MTEEPHNLILEQLRAIRAEQAETSHKIGALAESMVSMRKQIAALGGEVDKLRGEMDALRGEVHAMRADMRMIAIAVDEHTARLERIEKRLGLVEA
jgi:uncharacterized coiled-coil DUF342 family protein